MDDALPVGEHVPLQAATVDPVLGNIRPEDVQLALRAVEEIQRNGVLEAGDKRAGRGAPQVDGAQLLPVGEDDARVGAVPALAGEPIRLEHVALVAVALVPRPRHLAAQLGAGAPRLTGPRLCAVTQAGVQLLARRAGAAVPVRRVVAGELAGVQGGGAVVFCAEQALVGAVLAVGDSVAEPLGRDALGPRQQGVAGQAGVLAGGGTSTLGFI